jgi:hypothetical protein
MSAYIAYLKLQSLQQANQKIIHSHSVIVAVTTELS